MIPKLSVVINTLNEAKLLPRVISSVKKIADEIVVVDMESTDGSADVAKKLGAKVYTHKKVSYVEPVRNFAVGKATGEWILVLDADEEIPASLAVKIKHIISGKGADFVRIPRKNIIFGHFMEHSGWWPDYNIRLFKKGFVSWNEVIHAVPFTRGKGLDIPAKEDYAILHHHYDTTEKYITQMNRYTTVQADIKLKDGYMFEWRDLLIRPANEFFSRFFADQGYKDGIYGLALSLLQSFSELVFYLKIWQYSKFPDQEFKLKDAVLQMRQLERDLHFWQGDAMYKETGNLKDRIKRKLRI